VTYTTKEPLERNFSSRADYEEAWQRWRQLRDMNNAAVRRSREAKRKRVDDESPEDLQEQLAADGCDGCSGLASTLRRQRRQVSILLKALRNEAITDPAEQEEFAGLLTHESIL
jgi:hypothetical protein